MSVFLSSGVLFVALFGLLGLVLGSFISALTYRVPLGKNVVSGRSFCDNCNKSLPWFVNIPLFSFLFLGGRSLCCGRKISIRYPIIELVCMFGFSLLYALFGFFDVSHVAYYLLFLLTVSIFVIDFEHRIIPDGMTWLFLLLGLLSAGSALFLHLLSGFVFSLFLLFLHLITKGAGMGLGDVKLALAMGVWLGFEKGLVWMFTSFLTGGIVASILLLSGKAKLKQKIAFGPFLIIGFWIVLLFF